MKRIIRRLKECAVYFLLTQKRTLCKPSFVVILLLIPILGAVFAGSAQKDGAVVSIAVYADENDADARKVIDDLLAHPGVLRLSRVSSAREAEDAVKGGKADGAWIFLPDLRERARESLTDRDVKILRCVEQEESVFLSLARERFYMSFFTVYARAIFADDLQRLSGRMPDEEEVESYYIQSVKNDELVHIERVSGGGIREENLAVSPIRGLLALLILCGGMAAAILCANDLRNGPLLVFTGAKRRVLTFFEILCPTLDLTVVSYAAMQMLGLSVSPLYDAGALLLYMLACTGLCLLLLEIFGKPLPLGVSLLPLILMTIALTPVFVSIRSLRALSLALPTYHYLMAQNDPTWMLYTAIYAAAAFALTFLVSIFTRQKKNRAEK